MSPWTPQRDQNGHQFVVGFCGQMIQFRRINTHRNKPILWFCSTFRPAYWSRLLAPLGYLHLQFPARFPPLYLNQSRQQQRWRLSPKTKTKIRNLSLVIVTTLVDCKPRFVPPRNWCFILWCDVCVGCLSCPRVCSQIFSAYLKLISWSKTTVLQGLKSLIKAWHNLLVKTNAM